jgi:hypothetical protein
MTQRLNKMPTSITDEKERAQCLGELRHSITAIQTSVKALVAIPELVLPPSADPADWQKVLSAAADRRDAALEAIENDVILTQSAKEDAARQWRQWHKIVATHIGTICKNLAAWGNANWRWDESQMNIVPDRNLFAIAAEKSMRAVPPQAQEHATLIDGVRTALAALREWEDEKDVCLIPLQELLKLDAEELATKWVDGSIRTDHRFDKYGGIPDSFRKTIII